jgi:hypothetical protein
MYKRIPLATLAAALTVALMTAAAPGDDTKAADKPPADKAAAEPSPAARAALNDVQLALGLVHYARAHKTPEGLVTAALILHRTPTQPLKMKVEGGKEGASEAGLAPEALLEEARAMRKDDKALAGVVDRARDELKEAPRGGPGVNAGEILLGFIEVPPRGTAQMRVALLPWHRCRVAGLRPPPTGPVPLVTVTDDQGHNVPLTIGGGSTGGATYDFLARLNQANFLISIRNPTTAPQTYAVATYN